MPARSTTAKDTIRSKDLRLLILIFASVQLTPDSWRLIPVLHSAPSCARLRAAAGGRVGNGASVRVPRARVAWRRAGRRSFPGGQRASNESRQDRTGPKAGALDSCRSRADRPALLRPRWRWRDAARGLAD